MPKISVIIPVYNVEKYVETCVRSVLNQTLHDVEVICVDSISTDNSLQILQQLAIEDTRVRVVCLDKIRGLGRGRNKGLDLAQGEYVFFLDSDDFLDKNALELLWKTAQGEHLDVVTCRHYEYDNNTHIVSTPVSTLQLHHKTELKALIDSKADFADFAFYAPFAWGKLFRREIIERYRLRFPDGAVEDVPFTVSYLTVCRNAKELPQWLLYYRTGRAESLSRKNEKMLLDGIKNFSVLEKNLQQYGLFEQVKEPFLFNKMVLLIGDEHLFAGRLGKVDTSVVQQAYNLVRKEVLALDLKIFSKRNIWFRWKVNLLQKALQKNDLHFPNRLRNLRNIVMIFLNPYFKLKSKLGK